MDELTRVRQTTDPLARVRLATEAVSAYQDAINELGQIRREAVEELRAQGLTLTEIAERAGVSRARLSQLGAAKPKPERSVLSTGGSVTVVVPVEAAAYPDVTAGRPVVHREDAEFVERITGLARSFGISADTEYVETGEFLELNREGLIVTCGPRQSPWLEQVLTADTNYGFGRDERGWYLEDKESGERHRSPEDTNNSGDYAYLGVQPRPDGQGGWLYAAGIHAAGSRGAALYLEEHIKELHDETRGTLWSCLVRCEYQAADRRLLRSELLAPVKRRGRLRQRRTGR